MYSNCLIEAIRAKLKDPKNIHIHLYPPSLNRYCLHFYWIDEMENKVCEYCVSDPKPFDRFKILFKSEVKRRSRALFERRTYEKMKSKGWPLSKQIKIAKRLDFYYEDPTLL